MRKCTILKGWTVIKWGDGSGHLVDDRGQKRGSYDAATGEIDTGKGYQFFGRVSEETLINKMERIVAVEEGIIPFSALASFHKEIGM